MLFQFLIIKARHIILFNTPEGLNNAAQLQVYSNNKMSIQSYLKKDDKIIETLKNGYIADISNETAAEIAKDPSVAIVEEDQEVKAAFVDLIDVDHDKGYIFNGPTFNYGFTFERVLNPIEEFGSKEKDKDRMFERFIFRDLLNKPTIVQSKAPWGISRLSNGKAFKERSFKYPASAGHGVDVYIIDTGVQISHPEFKNAEWGINLVEGSIDDDEFGHGTHCAGIIAGQTTGIAKNAKIIAVKVLDGRGQGLISRVILGIDYVIKSFDQKLAKNEEIFRADMMENKEHKRNNMFDALDDYLKTEATKPKFVVNMSVGGLRSRALNFAIDYGSDLGIHFVVAAGNDHEDACLFSPGSSKRGITIGASTRDDKVAFFSNVGKCVDIFAPGMQITSSWLNSQYKIASGTSMAAPHAVGAMALYLGEKNYDVDELKSRLLRDAIKVIEDDSRPSNLLDFWPLSLFFEKKEIEKYPLISIKKLNYRITKARAFDYD